MWDEGASDLWGRLEESEDEAAALEAIRARLRGAVDQPASDDEEPALATRGAAA